METTQSAKASPAKHSANHLFSGIHFKFPEFRHDQHGKIINVNEATAEKLTMGQKVADVVASGMGSWNFIITQSIILIFWIVLNSVALFGHFDPFPFILLNLALSFQAAFAAPFIMISQNRQAEKDRLTAQNDYLTDVKGEQEICHIMDHLDHQDSLILQIVQRLEAQNQVMSQQEKLTLEIVQQLTAQNQRIELQRRQMLEWLHHAYPEVAKEMEEEADPLVEAGDQPEPPKA